MRRPRVCCFRAGHGAKPERSMTRSGSGVRAVITSEMPVSALGSFLGGIGQGDVLLDTGRRATPTELHVEATEVPQLRAVADQDARGTQTRA